MTKSSFALAVVVGALTTSVASAEITREAAREVLANSGISEQVLNVNARAQILLDDYLAAEQLPPDRSKQMIDAVELFKDTSQIVELLERRLARELLQSDVVALNGFFASRLGRKIASVEIAASTLTAWYQMEESLLALEERLERNPVRESFLARLDRLRRLSESGAALAAALYAGLVQGVTVTVKKQADNLYGLRYEAFRVSFLNSLRYANLVPLTYTYGPITDDELEQYCQFLNTQSASKVYDAVELVLRKYNFEAGEKFAVAVAELLDPAENNDRADDGR
jgi:hypothetical protein